VQKSFAPVLIPLALGVWLVACGADYGVQLVAGPVDVPECLEVAIFGNGAICLDPAGDPDLTACDAIEPACSVEGVCFDGAGLLVCRCAKDADCDGWAAHVNEARTSGGLSSVAVGCVLERCVALEN